MQSTQIVCIEPDGVTRFAHAVLISPSSFYTV